MQEGEDLKGGFLEELQEELANKESEIERLKELLENAKENEGTAQIENNKENELPLVLKVDQLERELVEKLDLISSMERQLSKIQDTLKQKEEELSRKSSILDQSSYRENELRQKLEEAEDKIQETEKKAGQLLSGAFDDNVNKAEEIDKLKRELQVKENTFNVLKAEYEKLKAKVRKYKADEESRVKDLQQRICELESGDGGATSALLTLNQSSLNKAKTESARAAVRKTESAYRKAIGDYTTSVHKMVAVFRERLVELVDFMQHLFALENEGVLDFSSMSENMRDALHQSMEKSRRLSQDVGNLSSILEDPNDTQRSFAGVRPTGAEIPDFPYPDISFDEVDSEAPAVTGRTVPLEDYETIVEELKENVKAKVTAESKLENLLKKYPELEEKSNVSSESYHAYETAPNNDENNEVWSQPDREESRKRMQGLARSKIPVKTSNKKKVRPS